MNEISDGGTSQSSNQPGRAAAIYARVSSDRQRREQTIQSQTAALRELAGIARICGNAGKIGELH